MCQYFCSADIGQNVHFFPQAEAGEAVLKILERSGLNRTQKGAALMLTVHGYETEVKIEDIGRMSRTDLANLYTVNSTKASPMPVQQDWHRRRILHVPI